MERTRTASITDRSTEIKAKKTDSNGKSPGPFAKDDPKPSFSTAE
jgi:hypothetical protein